MYMKKMPFPMKKKAPSEKSMPKEEAPSEKELALELEVESEEEPEMEGEEMDLKSMMAKGETEEGGMLAEASDEELMAEMKKRGLMPAEAAAKPPM